MQVAALVVVQKEDVADMACACRAESESFGAPDGGALAAGEERVVDSLVGLGLLRGLDGTTLQVFHCEWDVFGSHKGLLIDGLGDCLVGLKGLKGLDELRGGLGLDELHGVESLGGVLRFYFFSLASLRQGQFLQFLFCERFYLAHYVLRTPP
jgi:hypothetical protein